MIRPCVFLLALFAGFAPPPSVAATTTAPPEVAVSIMPVHALTAAIMAGVGTPRLLIPANASPHDYALKPSQARLLARARLVVRVGPALESTLERPLRALAATARRLDLIDVPDLIHPRGGTGRDMHIWLNPLNARIMADAITQTLASIDPPNASRYGANMAALSERLLALDADLQRRLSPLSTRAYVVFHNAYEHLEARYGLRHAGVVAVNPDRPPGAASIRRIRHIMAAHKVSCVFASPQFSPRLAHAIATEPSVRVVSLDPLGTGLTPGGEAYFQLMDNLASAFEDCLS